MREHDASIFSHLPSHYTDIAEVLVIWFHENRVGDHLQFRL